MSRPRISAAVMIAECIVVLEPVFGNDTQQCAMEVITYITDSSALDIRLNPDKYVFDDDLREKILDACRRRLRREPIQYIVGKAYFMHDIFAVGPGVLIPRNDTELLVETAAELCDTRHFRFIEFCTGSGCVAISLIKQLRNRNIDVYGTATDISTIALDFARKNATQAAVGDRISIIRHDILSMDMPSNMTQERTYDCVLSNPPYIMSNVINLLDPEVRDYEPSIALDGGSDGLIFYRALISNAGRYLRKNGLILLEIGFDQAEGVSKLFEKTGNFSNIRIIKDYSGNDRVISAKIDI